MSIIDQLNNGEIYRNVAYNFRIKYKVYAEKHDRILFHGTKKSNNNNDINGIVVERVAGVYKQVCWPLPSFSNDKINKEEEFLVFPLHDGTIINKYYSLLDQKWLYGTRCSSDITRESWRGNKYSEILPRFFKNDDDDLDIKKTYVYVLTCPEIHYLQDSLKLISINTDGDFHFVEEPKNIPIQDVLRIKGFILRGKNNFMLENIEQKNKRKMMYEPFYFRQKKSLNFAKKRNTLQYFVESKCYFLGKDLKYFGEFKDEALKCFEVIDKIFIELLEFIEQKKESSFGKIFDKFTRHNSKKIYVASKYSDLKVVLLQIKDIVFLFQECLTQHFKTL